MSEYRRWYVPGGTYFFTIVTHLRRPILTSEIARNSLHDAISKVQSKRPFDLPAIVLLPDHVHMLVSLPPGDDNYSLRLSRIKEEFTERYLAAGGRDGERSASRRRKHERGIWQRRFWEHTVEDEEDFERHFDYIHYNPVKHGYVASPVDWLYSSFHRWAAQGVYEIGWGRSGIEFDDIDETAME